MTRLFKNWKSFYKGMLFALAFIMAFTFVPMDAIELLSKAAEPADKDYNTITLSADAKNTVTRGGTYPISYALFKAKGSTETQKIGSKDVANSSVKVTYKGTDDEEKIKPFPGDVEDETIFGYFTPTRVGTYAITYSITVEGKTYTYEHDVACTIAKSSFNFYDLKKQEDGSYVMNGNLPNVYDLNYLNDLKDKTGDVTLPLPTLLKDDGKPFEEVSYVTAATNTGNEVVITLSTPNDNADATIDKDGEDFVIKASNLQVAGNYTITYTFKQNGEYIDSVQKTFEVRNGYFYKDSEKQEAGYTLETEWATSVPTAARTKVKQQLPKVVGRTSSTNSPAKETVPVSYTISVQRKNDNGKYEAVEGDYIVVEDDNYYFYALQDGDYLITYSVWDYYTGSAEKPAVDTNKTYIEIKDVKDTDPPTVYVYDANPTYHKEGDEYVSAASKLKSVTSHDNIIIYAIGGKDNADENLELRRSIIDSGSVERFTTTKYADKNLILQFTGYENLISQNYALRHDMETGEDKVDFKSEKVYTTETVTSIQNWLLNHNYLIVTNRLDKVPDGSEDGKAFDYDADVTTNDQKIAALEKAGYAYVEYPDYKFTNSYASSGDADDRTATYTVRYEAKDSYVKDNNLTPPRLSYTMKLASTTYTDKVAPTITGPQNLYSTYLDTDTISFTAPTASDATDTTERLDVITAYRFLNGDVEISRSGVADAEQTVEFTPGEEGVNADVPVRTASKGWYFIKADDNNQMSIDVSTKPESANRVQILIYTVDDYGNIGQWKKTMEIINTGDDDAPQIVYVENGDTTAKYKQGEKITLPTIQYTDKHVGFMTAQVFIENTQKTTVDDGDDVITHHTLTNQNMNASAYPYMGTYTIDAGSFRADYSGDYIVTIVARDGGGHSIATYFEYTVTPVIRVEDIKIDNIYETSINRKVTAPFSVDRNEDGIYRLSTPTLNLPKVDGYKFAGVSELDDANTALDYYINVISAGGAYDLTSTYFQGYDAQTYKFQYMVKLVGVPTGENANDKVSIDESGRVKITDSETYYVYVKEDGKLGANAMPSANDKNGLGKELTLEGSSIEETYGLEGFILPSEVITLTYSSADAPIVTIDPGNIKAQYAEVGGEIVLPRISASTAKGELDQAQSRVVIQVAKSGGTTTLATIHMNEWETSPYFKKYTGSEDVKEEQRNQLVFKLEYNGEYIITYYAVEKDNTKEGTKVIRFKNGDTITPEFNVNAQKGFITDATGKIKKIDEFKIGDVLLLHKDKIEVTDRGGSTTADDYKNDLAKPDAEQSLVKFTVKRAGQDVDYTVDGTTYSYNLDTAGDYVISVTVVDNAGWGWDKPETITITVKPEGTKATVTYETIGTILIVISAVILAGVVGYFIYSKVKLDKENKKSK